MAEIRLRRILLQSQRGFRTGFEELSRSIVAEVETLLVRFADTSGVVPVNVADEVADMAGQIYQSRFVAGRRSFRNGSEPITPFATLLMSWVGWATWQVVERHGEFMRRRLPDDLLPVFENGGNRDGLVSEQSRSDILRARAIALRLFSPNPFASYEPAHTWVDPAGYRLSDRIWRTSQRSRLQLDALLTQRIAEGTPSLQIAREVETFLLPGRGFRTRRPYGTDASFDAMRLARTEITRAHGQASMIAARLNPYVESMDWVLSPSHPKPDICDDLAAGSPYDLDRIPPYPAHPHDLCTLIPNVTQDRTAVEDEIRARLMESERELNLTPVQVQEFSSHLVGEFVMGLARNIDAIARATA